MTKVEIELPAATAKAASEAGLLTPQALDRLLIDAIDDAEAGYMVSLRRDRTGVDNTIFVSTKGHGRHAARIKIAINPPHSYNETCEGASMAIHDYSIRGAYVPPRLIEQAKQFIERNRDVLLGYWNGEFDTEELFKRLQPPPHP